MTAQQALYIRSPSPHSLSIKKRADEQGVSEKCVVHCKDTVWAYPRLNLFIVHDVLPRYQMLPVLPMFPMFPVSGRR